MFVCRICLCQVSDQFFSFSYGNPSVREKLVSCIPDMEEGAYAGAVICNSCLLQVNSSYEFWNKCVTNHKIVRAIMSFHPNTTDINSVLSNFLNGQDNPPGKEEIKREQDEPPLDLLKIKSEEETAPADTDHKNASLCDLPIPSTVKVDRPEKSKYSCHICCRAYTRQSLLKTHLQMHSQEVPRHKKLLNMLPPLILKDVKAHASKPCTAVRCRSCNISLNCTHHLSYHHANYHCHFHVRNVDITVTCNLCREQVRHRYLRLHLHSHKYKVVLTDIFEKTMAVSQGPYLVVKYWRCDDCGFLSYKREEFLDHCDSLHKIKTEPRF